MTSDQMRKVLDLHDAALLACARAFGVSQLAFRAS